MYEKRLIKLIATDLDGTFLQDDKSISNRDMTVLRKLGEKGVVRVAATGRSLHKVNEVLSSDTPFDFIVFSSGGGIYDWNEKRLLISEHFDKDLSISICHFLINLNLNFIVFRPIPTNNIFLFHHGVTKNEEFENYLFRHKVDSSKLEIEKYSDYAGQFLSIIPDDEELFNSISKKLTSAFEGIRVIRTTSPIDNRSIWLEIFPESVSKGHGLKWLCDKLAIPYSQTAGVGNDYNDIEMLDFVKHPYILGNSPNGLKENYSSVNYTNNESGFSKVIEQLGL
jgi:Cof subfamily protein (haloacid dehalogenase superfamily)